MINNFLIGMGDTRKFYSSTCNQVSKLFQYDSEYFYLYRIMQIVRGGKVSRLHDLVIRGKTFAIA